MLPYTGTVRISGPVIKGLTTGSVGIQIYQDSMAMNGDRFPDLLGSGAI